MRFLKNIPLFGTVSNNVVGRLHHSMGIKKVCLRGQVIAREGKSADNLFIIYEGEFEQVKTVTSEVKEKK